MNAVYVLGATRRKLKAGEQTELVDSDEFQLILDKYTVRLEIETEVEQRDDIDDDDDDDDDDVTQEMQEDADELAFIPQQQQRADDSASTSANASTTAAPRMELCYQFADQRANQLALARARHDPETWKKFYALFTSEEGHDASALRGLRVSIMEGCLDCLSLEYACTRASQQARCWLFVMVVTSFPTAPW
jgi:hypothetical protein